MDKISTSELVAKISASTGFNKKMVKEIVTDQVAQINGHVANGTAVQVAGLGKFYPHDRRARTMETPMTGRKVEIPAKRVLSFKAAKKA